MKDFAQPKDILPKILKKLGIEKEALAALVLEVSRQVFLEKNLEGEPFRFKDGDLFVRVKSSGQASEILMVEKEMIKKINQKIRKNLVKRIKTRVSF